MNADTIASNALTVLSPVLLAGLSWLSVKAAQLISAKVANERLRGILLRIDDAVVAIVREISQVWVSGRKAASPCGTLTPEQRAQAKQAALDSVMSQLGTKGLAEVEKVLGLAAEAVEAFLATRIEAAVHRLQTTAPPAQDAGTAGDAVPFAA